MANTKGAKTAKKPAVKKEIPVVEEAPIIEQSASAAPEKVVYTAKSLSPNMLVTVRNGFGGLLVYRSQRTGELFQWQNFGDEQDMELQELRNAKNSSKAFFENNWFLIDNQEVVDWLGVGQYYKTALDLENFDELFKSSPDKIGKIIATTPAGQKESIAYRAKQLINDGEIDSIKLITALEKALGTELIER